MAVAAVELGHALACTRPVRGMDAAPWGLFKFPFALRTSNQQPRQQPSSGRSACHRHGTGFPQA